MAIEGRPREENYESNNESNNETGKEQN